MLYVKTVIFDDIDEAMWWAVEKKVKVIWCVQEGDGPVVLKHLTTVVTKEKYDNPERYTLNVRKIMPIS